MSILDAVGSVSSEITLEATKEESGARLRHGALQLVINAGKAADQVLQKASDGLKIVKQAGQKVSQKFPSSSILSKASEKISSASDELDHLKAEHAAKLDEEIEKDAWARIDIVVAGSVRKKGMVATTVARMASSLSDENSSLTRRKERVRDHLPQLSRISLPSLSEVSLPAVSSLPDLPSLSAVSLPALPALPSLPAVSLPALPALHLPSLDAISSRLSGGKIHEYVEKATETVAEKIADKSGAEVEKAGEESLRQKMDPKKKEADSGLQELFSEEASELMDAASVIARCKIAACKRYLNDGVQKAKGAVTAGLHAAGNALENCCCLSQLPDPA